jgi:hypothetical protein
LPRLASLTWPKCGQIDKDSAQLSARHGSRQRRSIVNITVFYGISLKFGSNAVGAYLAFLFCFDGHIPSLPWYVGASKGFRDSLLLPRNFRTRRVVTFMDLVKLALQSGRLDRYPILDDAISHFDEDERASESLLRPVVCKVAKFQMLWLQNKHLQACRSFSITCIPVGRAHSCGPRAKPMSKAPVEKQKGCIINCHMPWSSCARAGSSEVNSLWSIRHPTAETMSSVIVHCINTVTALCRK